MKNLFFLLLLFSTVALYPQSFHSLDGIENQNNQTELLYRLGSDYYPFNPVYKFNTNDLTEEMIMEAYNSFFPGGQLAKAVWDFEFFPDNINFMNVGYQINPDNHSYIARNDSIVFDGISGYERVDISQQDPQKVFAFVGDGVARSFDGGFTFPLDSVWLTTDFIPFSLADFDDEVFFGFDFNNQFMKNAAVVDTSKIFFDEYTNILYDINQFHIYRVNKTYGGYTLNVSNNKGNAYTWTKTYQSENPFFITIDSSNSGLVFLADGRKIYKSTNNGYNFVLYKNLESRIVGIYKKPDSDILYAATRNKIFEITDDEITVIKSIPVPPEILNYYPLAIGNKWIYGVNTFEYYPYPSGSYTIVKREVIGDSIAANNKKYFVIHDPTDYPYTVLERIDSLNGKIFRYFEHPDLTENEYLIDDLFAEVGDTIQSYRRGFWQQSHTVLLDEIIFEKWGLTKSKRVFEQYLLDMPVYSLTQNVGLDSIYFQFDFGETYISLNGCIINGELYGDTSMVVSVEDENEAIPSEFKLHQNYPNPFNPSTVISWQSPVGSRQTLKVYDVLGREVATLVDEYREAGYYEVEFNSAGLASGIYYYQLKVGSYIKTKKMVVVK